MEQQSLNNFIVNTANDYDLSYSEVETIYNAYLSDKIGFYNELENYIKNKTN